MLISKLPQVITMSYARMTMHKPIVVVLGATGTGKSKLAIEVARKFNGEIISADSMQVYKELDIITNKVTVEEQQEAKHHLLGFVDPLDNFHVHDYQKAAIACIDNLHQQNKLPVIVGGTHYYIESVLWNVLVDIKNKPRPLPYKDYPVSSSNSNNNSFGNESDLNSVNRSDLNKSQCLQSALYQKENNTNNQLQLNEVPTSSALGLIGSKILSKITEKFENFLGSKCEKEVHNSSESVVKSKESVSASARCLNYPETSNAIGSNSENNIVNFNNVCISNKNVQVTECSQYSSNPGDEVPSISSDLFSSSNKSRNVSQDASECFNEASNDGSNRQYWRDMPDPTEHLYADLCRIDPNRARELFPRDRRKIIRSLEIWQSSGKTHSEIIQQQRESEGGSVLGGGLRYPNTVLLWTACEQDVLDKRLDGRVDDMLKRGLLDELLQFHERYNKERLPVETTRDICDTDEQIDLNNKITHEDDQPEKINGKLNDETAAIKEETLDVNSVGEKRKSIYIEEENDCKKRKIENTEVSQNLDLESQLQSNVVTEDVFVIESELDSKSCNITKKNTSTVTDPKADYTLGIFQNIGFKEFHDYLILPEHIKQTDKGQKLYDKGVELLKLATRRYARRQIKWIKNRFTKELQRKVPALYSLDATDPEQWSDRVNAPAIAIVESLLSDKQLPSHIAPVPMIPEDPAHIQGRFERNFCTVCDRVFIGRRQWELHTTSNNHKRMKDSKAKAEKMVRQKITEATCNTAVSA